METEWKAAGSFPPVSPLDGMHRWLFLSLLLSLLPQSQESSSGRRKEIFILPVMTFRVDQETITAPKFTRSSSDLTLCWNCQALIPCSITGKKALSQWVTYESLASGLNIASTALHGLYRMPALISQRFELFISLLNLDTVTGISFHIAARTGSQNTALNHSLSCSLHS